MPELEQVASKNRSPTRDLEQNQPVTGFFQLFHTHAVRNFDSPSASDVPDRSHASNLERIAALGVISDLRMPSPEVAERREVGRVLVASPSLVRTTCSQAANGCPMVALEHS